MFEPVMQYNISSNTNSDFQSKDNNSNGMKFISKERVYTINGDEIHTRASYFNFGEDMECVEECSSPSWISNSESEINETFEEENYGLRSTREKLTRDWVRRTFVENDDSNFNIDPNLVNGSFVADCEFTSVSTDEKEKSFYSKFFSNSKSDEDTDMSEPELQVDNSVVFADRKTNEIECSLDSTISFLQVVTEENCKDGLSFSTRGSLSCFVDDEFSEEEDEIEFMFSAPSLSSAVLPGLCDQNDSSLSQGFVHNAFENFFDFKKISKALQDINDKWNNSMEDIEDKPREALKVSFAPSEELVTVHSFEKTFEESLLNDSSALDELRFKRRIEDLNTLLSPFFTSEHRAKIISRNTFDLVLSLLPL